MSLSRKILLGCLLVTFFISCQSKKNEPAQNIQPINNDSTSSVRSEFTSSSAYIPVDVSPMDMSYFPADYPKLKMMDSISIPPVMRIIYSRPHLQGRELFENILKYGEPWRLGANEATEIQFYRDVTIQNKKISAGRYIIYCIPEKDKWTVVLNSNIDTWGLKIDQKKDLFRFQIPVTDNNPILEYLSISFEKTKTGADLVMAWDDVIARLPVSF